MKSILVATDLTTKSAHALDRAIQLASVTQAKLHVFHQAPALRLPGARSRDENASFQIVRNEIEKAIKQNKDSPNITYEICLESRGRVHEVIDERARRTHADLVVMGLTHKGNETPSFVSTTIERVIKTGNYPVLMVSRKVKGPYQKALFFLDMDDLSGSAFELVAQFCPKATFLLLPTFNVLSESPESVWAKFQMKRYSRRRTRFIDAARRALEMNQSDPGAVRYHAIDGRGGDFLPVEAHEQQADLTCADLHRYTAPLHLRVKGFVGKLLEHPPCDVLIMKRV